MIWQNSRYGRLYDKTHQLIINEVSIFCCDTKKTNKKNCIVSLPIPKFLDFTMMCRWFHFWIFNSGDYPHCDETLLLCWTVFFNSMVELVGSFSPNRIEAIAWNNWAWNSVSGFAFSQNCFSFGVRSFPSGI